jgi:peptidylprolyl isomerase/FKBP-type peptidyl-prolyl cis-trans isomerase SlpA
MPGIKEGDKVNILCEAKLEDGTIYYKNKKENPLEFVVGEGKFFPAVEDSMKGMKKGESKTITLEPKDAFGEHKENLVFVAPKDKFSSESKIDIGAKVKVNMDSGQTVQGTITEKNNGTYTVDFNHPLAGRKVVFTITVVSIEGN